MENNTRPFLLKRFAADGFDITCLFVLFMLLSVLLRNTALFATYNMHVANYMAIQQEVVASNDWEDVNEILNNDERYQNEVFAAVLHSNLIAIFIGFIGETVLYLIIPLIDKDGLTLGKKLCGIMLFDERRQTKARKWQIVYRFVLNVLAGAALYPWTGIYTFLLYPVLRFIVLILNRKNKTLCDLLTSTMLIERESYSSI